MQQLFGHVIYQNKHIARQDGARGMQSSGAARKCSPYWKICSV